MLARVDNAMDVMVRVMRYGLRIINVLDVGLIRAINPMTVDVQTSAELRLSLVDGCVEFVCEN
jgi:hypothetical protein